MKQIAFKRLSLAPAGYRPPLAVDLKRQLLPSSNQGRTSMCAAYTMAGWLEFWNWKLRGVCQQIDPEPIYARAKQIDGLGGGDGTTLEAVFQAAQDLNLMSAVAQESVREIATAEEVKEALHRHGVVLTGFQITEGWLRAKPDGWIESGGMLLGGHAALTCAFSSVEDPEWFGVQNSAGVEYGWNGFCRMSRTQFDQEFMYGLVWDARA